MPCNRVCGGMGPSSNDSELLREGMVLTVKQSPCKCGRHGRIPLLLHADALVVEGTVAGCIAAHALAREGRATALAIGGFSVAFEIVVCRRPWTTEQDLARLPEPFQRAFRKSIWRKAAQGELLLNLADVARQVEDLLLDAGVRLYYGMHPCGVMRAADRSMAGVIFGGKFGLRAISADRVVDCTPEAIVPSLAGHPPERRGRAERLISVRLSAKAGVASPKDPLTEDRGQRCQCPTAWPEERKYSVAGTRVELHGPYAEFIFQLTTNVEDPLWRPLLANAAHNRLVDTGARIMARRAAEGKGRLFFHRFSDGLLIEPLFRIRAGRKGGPFQPAGLDRLWVCGPAADVDDKFAARLADPYRCANSALDVAQRILRTRIVAKPAKTAVLSLEKPKLLAKTGAEFRFLDTTPVHGGHGKIAAPTVSLPVVAECDVLVAGGGTSGVPAALAAAQYGTRTILLEQHADVGGTRTVGGVGSYWFGRETPCQRACDDAYDRCSRRCGMAEEIAMRQCLGEAGVSVLAGCSTIGVVRERDRVVGAVVVTDRGLAVVRAKVVIDATGDADLAAWAGAPFEYGNGRDAWTLWASFANFNQKKRPASRHYDSSILVNDPYDLVRSIVAGRRLQGMWKRYRHEMPQHYVAPRESRRIHGRATVTYGGVLAGETFPDVMVVCESNVDIKGIASSDLLGCGVVSSWDVMVPFAAAVPYRAILPRKIENLLVAGKAYSASHDAQALARMQRDMVSLGAAAGIAAAFSVRNGVPPARLDIRALQDEWVLRGVLLDKDRQRYGRPSAPYTAEDAERDLRKVRATAARRSCRLARLMRAPASRGPLRRAFKTADMPAKADIARALCYLGDSTGVPFLVETVRRQIGNGLPPMRCKALHVLPEHGWAADPVYSLFAIGLTPRAADAANLLKSVAEQVEDNAGRFATARSSQFEYVKVVCAVAERNAGRMMLPALEVLLTRKCLRGLAVRYDSDPRLGADPAEERRAYLELCLGRALARCGDPRGYEILRAYVNDIRGTFAQSAQTELRELQDCGGRLSGPSRQRSSGRNLRKIAAKPFRRRID